MKKNKLIGIFIIIVFVFSLYLSILPSIITKAASIPATPSNFSVVSAGYNSTKCTWNSVSGAAGYQVYRALSSEGTYKWMKTTTSRSAMNTGLETGKTYYYKVRAFKYIGSKRIYSKFSAIDRVKPVPSTPSNFKSVPTGVNSAKSSWNAVSGASGYQIYRAAYKTGTYKRIKTTTSTSYTNTGLVEERSYFYKVRAYRTVGSGRVYGSFTSVYQVNNPVPTGGSKRIVGYYAAWSAYSGFYPAMVNTDQLTHINYAFANIGSDLKIKMGYPDIDADNFMKLNELKKVHPNLKTIISVGGWSWSSKFSDAALTDASRTVFANSCVDFIIKYNFDGVDIDWEYPVRGGLSTNISRPEDKVNFTLLMKKIREKLDARGKLDGKHYLLTFAGASSNAYLNNTEMSKLHTYVDYANVMTYDIHGMWDRYTDFNAPLYSNTDVTLQYKGSVDQSVNSWLKTGIPANKIVVGVPFYGYVYKEVLNVNNGLYQSYKEGDSISYKDIVDSYLNISGYTRFYHEESKVPWLYNGSSFLSYDDAQSIGLKAEYIQSKGVGGGMIWELSQDYNGTLLEALYHGIK